MTRAKRLWLSGATAFSCLMASSSAWAVDGRTAVGMCIDSTASGARCAWSVNDKGEIDICNKNGCVYCPSATDQCTMARQRPKPGSALPTGTVVNTQLGTHKVKPRNRMDQLIRKPALARP